MDKRFLLFWVLVVLMWAGWAKYMEVFHPAPKRKAIAKANPAKAAEKPDAKNAKQADKVVANGNAAVGKPADGKPVDGKPAEKKAAAVGEPIVPLRENLTLGKNEDSRDAEFALFATLSNKGACVSSLQLNHYRDETRKQPLLLLKSPTPAYRSYAMDIEQDPNARLDIKTWEVAESTPEKIVFRTKCMDGKLQVEKHFRVEKGSNVLQMDVAFKNLGKEPIGKVSYRMMGGCGLPVEGEWYTQYFRNIHVGMKAPNAAPNWAEVSAAEVAAAVKAKKKPQAFSETPIQYAGVVVQYFGSLVIPKADPNGLRRLANVQPLLVAPNLAKPQLSDIAVEMTSMPAALASGEEFKHEYLMYNGPKEPNALAEFEPYGVPNLIHYGSFLGLPTGQISRFLAWILTIFYSVVRDYGLAIMMLTLCVRSAMFPLSFRQAKSMQRMAELQPKIEELKKRYGSEKEKFARAQMDLMAKEKVNPLGGCLPLFIQLPIFVGLYGALSQNFHLRHSSFLWNMTWIKDLAAPDQLFGFGMAMPALGPFFNLLPVISVTQMVWQMKKFSPPATTPEMKMQQSMMMYMSIFMAFMFYLVPAGLCVYFITSGAWTFMERKFLPKPKTPIQPPSGGGLGGLFGTKSPGQTPAGGGLFGGLVGENKEAEKNGNKSMAWIKPVTTKKDKKSRR